MSGFEVAEQIKARPALAAIPVIHVSAHAVDVADRAQGLTRGADAYLAEPIEPDELVATAHAVLRYYRARRQAETLAAGLTRLAETTVAVNSARTLSELSDRGRARGGRDLRQRRRRGGGHDHRGQLRRRPPGRRGHQPGQRAGDPGMARRRGRGAGGRPGPRRRPRAVAAARLAHRRGGGRHRPAPRRPPAAARGGAGERAARTGRRAATAGAGGGGRGRGAADLRRGTPHRAHLAAQPAAATDPGGGRLSTSRSATCRRARRPRSAATSTS